MNRKTTAFTLTSAAGLATTLAFALTAAPATGAAPSTGVGPKLGQSEAPQHMLTTVKQHAAFKDLKEAKFDLLAVDGEVGAQRLSLGVVVDGQACRVSYSEATPESSSTSCGMLQRLANNIEFTRGDGLDVSGHITGRAPRSAVEVRLRGEDGSELTVPAFDAGDKWSSANFTAVWPGGLTTTIEAFDKQGRVVAHETSGALQVQ